MARQVNTFSCSAVGCYSTTHCHLHDQSVHTTGGLYVLFFFVFLHATIILKYGKNIQCAVMERNAQSRKACFVMVEENSMGIIFSSVVISVLGCMQHYY